MPEDDGISHVVVTSNRVISKKKLIQASLRVSPSALMPSTMSPT